MDAKEVDRVFVKDSKIEGIRKGNITIVAGKSYGKSTCIQALLQRNMQHYNTVTMFCKPFEQLLYTHITPNVYPR